MAWVKANKAAKHYDVCVRTMRNWQALGFPTVKIGGTVLFDLDAGDQWLREQHSPANDVNRVLDDLLRDL